MNLFPRRLKCIRAIVLYFFVNFIAGENDEQENEQGENEHAHFALATRNRMLFRLAGQVINLQEVAATVRLESDTIAEARIGLTNMGSTPVRARVVEEALAGQPATEDAVRAAAERAADGTNPPSDLNGDADYRRHLARVLTRRAVLAAAGAA